MPPTPKRNVSFSGVFGNELGEKFAEKMKTEITKDVKGKFQGIQKKKEDTINKKVEKSKFKPLFD